VVGALDAYGAAVERAVDLGDVNGRPFVNNVSFGAYAAIVERPEYRDEKLKTTLDLLPDLLTSTTGPRLVAHADAVTLQGPQALLVSTNPYNTGDVAGLGRRPRIDGGVLGVIGVRAANAVQAARMLRGRKAAGLSLIVADEVVVDADVAEVPAGVDGESVRLTTPVRCRVRPGALRVRVPRGRPGVPPPSPTLQLSAVLELAGPGRRDGQVSAAAPAEG
jgi:diacylglycerol kinase family enzyme